MRNSVAKNLSSSAVVRVIRESSRRSRRRPATKPGREGEACPEALSSLHLQAVQRTGTTCGCVGLRGDSNAKCNREASYPQGRTVSVSESTDLWTSPENGRQTP